jgi:hypothetical protein
MGARALEVKRIAATHPGMVRDCIQAIADIEADSRFQVPGAEGAKKGAQGPFRQTADTLFSDAMRRIRAQEALAIDTLERTRSAGIAQILSDPQRYESAGRQAAALGGVALRRLIRAIKESDDQGFVESTRAGIHSRPARSGDDEALAELARIGEDERDGALADLVAVRQVAAAFEMAGPLADNRPLLMDPMKATELANAAKLVPDGNGGTTTLSDAEVSRLLKVAGVE